MLVLDVSRCVEAGHEICMKAVTKAVASVLRKRIPGEVIEDSAARRRKSTHGVIHYQLARAPMPLPMHRAAHQDLPFLAMLKLSLRKTHGAHGTFKIA